MASASGEDLVAALEQATLMAKQLSTTTNPHQILQIYTTLHSTHRHLSLFLSGHHPYPPALQPPPENSVPSALGGGRDDNGDTGGDPMQMGDEDAEQDSKATTSAAAIDKVEEKMRECFIQNKRTKRQLSPSAEQRQSKDNGDVMGGAVAANLDPHGTKLRSLDLLYQFHG
ncbi:unnamed protein product [Fraxinus pennsylvanica]|uniref:Uncharacterized protein n=1 Tax=Fraxinus pennsylvanica TaxID=56036 RepID=A0AAD2DYC3_9LAMI|nr:unnamed protein product [Fraxinus pennsylvanica]